MTRVYERPEEAAAVGKRARADLLEGHSYERTADFIRARLSGIPESVRRLLEIREPLDHAAATLDQPPGYGLAGETSFLNRIVRRVLRRILWPQLAEQRRLDAELVDSVKGVMRELDRVVTQSQRNGSDPTGL